MLGRQHGAFSRLRILVIVENLSVPFDRRVWNEARTLTAAGHEVTVICPKADTSQAAFEILEGVRIYRHPLPFEARSARDYPLEYTMALFWQLVLATRVKWSHGFDVIQACNPPDTIFLLAHLFKFLFGTKFVFDHHDLCPELFLAKFGKKGFCYRLLAAFERWTFRAADISIATNQSYKQIAMERGKVPADRVFVVRSGPEIERFQPVPANPRWKAGKDLMIGYLGVMGKQEGIDYLLRAMAEIVHERGRRDVHLTLVGGGPERDALAQMARTLGLDDHVTFTGRVSDHDLVEALCTADVCVNPDEVNPMNDKSTMNKILEYMALGKAMVQFETVEGRFSAGESSLYARPNDERDLAAKIMMLLDDPDQRARMGALGRARVLNELAWDHQRPKLLAAYEAVALSEPTRFIGDRTPQFGIETADLELVR
ncbi:MAG: glycosyltransferase family 4 protein [Geminicoccaceae bacterium]